MVVVKHYNVIGFFFDGEEAQQPAIFATLHRQDFQEVEEDYEPNNDLDNSLAPEIKDGVGKNNYNEGKKDITYSYTGTSAGNKQVMKILIMKLMMKYFVKPMKLPK